MTEPEPARTTPQWSGGNPECSHTGSTWICFCGATIEPAPTTPEPSEEGTDPSEHPGMTAEEIAEMYADETAPPEDEVEIDPGDPEGHSPMDWPAPPEDQGARLVAEMRKVIMCLRLEVEPSIANDVQARFEEVAALLAQKDAEIAAHREDGDRLADVIEELRAELAKERERHAATRAELEVSAQGHLSSARRNIRLRAVMLEVADALEAPIRFEGAVLRSRGSVQFDAASRLRAEAEKGTGS
jgi:hypothetical protein